MREPTYQDFDVLLERVGRKYRARVVNSPVGGTEPIQFILPFSAEKLENFLLKIGQPRRRGIRKKDWPQTAAIKDFGAKLFEALFRNELRDSLLRSLIVTERQGMGLRLRLRLSETPKLAELPWEFLYEQRRDRFLCLSTNRPLVRYLEVSEPPEPLAVSPPLRVLVVTSSPIDSDLEPLEVEQEWAKLHEALDDPISTGRVVLEPLKRATLRALRRQLRQGDYHIFHFIGHGGFNQDLQDGVLIFEDEDGRAKEVRGDQLGRLLNEHYPMRLAVLNACEGARGDVTDPFAGSAQSLIQQGLPAVLAMQFEITDRAAIVFARELYAAIADGYPLDAALGEARGAIRDEVSEVEWATPVLYSRAPDGRIFSVLESEVTKNAPRTLSTAPNELAEEVEEAKPRVEEVGRPKIEEAKPQVEEPAPHAEKPTQPQEEQAAPESDVHAAIQAKEPAKPQTEKLAQPAAEAQEAERAAETEVGRLKAHEEPLDELRAQYDRQQIVDLHAEMRLHARNGNWQAVLDVSGQIARLDPTAADPEGIASTAREELHATATRISVNLPEFGESITEGTITHESPPEVREVMQTAGGGRTPSDPAPQRFDKKVPSPSTGSVMAGDKMSQVEALSPVVDAERVALWQAAGYRTTPDQPHPRPASAGGRRVGRRALQTLLHPEEVTAVAFSSNGGWLATGGTNRTARLWDTASGREIRAFERESKRVPAWKLSLEELIVARRRASEASPRGTPTRTSVALSWTGYQLATAVATSPEVLLWDTSTGKLRSSIGADQSVRVWDVTLSRDGRLLVTGGDDGSARVWDVSDGRQLIKVSHGSQLVTVALSPNGRLLVTGGDDGSARVWDVSNLWDHRSDRRGRRLGHATVVTTVAFAPNGRWLATGSNDGSARVWEAATGRELQAFQHDDTVMSVVFAPHGAWLASGSWDKTARIWNIAASPHSR